MPGLGHQHRRGRAALGVMSQERCAVAGAGSTGRLARAPSPAEDLGGPPVGQPGPAAGRIDVAGRQCDPGRSDRSRGPARSCGLSAAWTAAGGAGLARRSVTSISRSPRASGRRRGPSCLDSCPWPGGLPGSTSAPWPHRSLQARHDARPLCRGRTRVIRQPGRDRRPAVARLRGTSALPSGAEQKSAGPHHLAVLARPVGNKRGYWAPGSRSAASATSSLTGLPAQQVIEQPCLADAVEQRPRRELAGVASCRPRQAGGERAARRRLGGEAGDVPPGRAQGAPSRPTPGLQS